MSAPAATVRPVRRLRVAVGADVLAAGGLALVAAALLAATWGTWGDLDSDTGFDLIAGARVADGELPYRDFTYYYGPLAPLVMGLVSLAGSGFGPAVALGIAVALAIVAATYALARTLVGPLGAFLAAAITAAVAFTPNNYSYVLPHTYAATFGTLLLLGFLLCLSRYAATRRAGWLPAAGAAAGLVALTKPEVTAAALAAGTAWLVLAGRGRRREAALLAGPALLVPAVVYGAFLTAVSPRELVLGNLYPVDELAAGGDTLVRARMPLTLESLAIAGGRFLLYAVGAAALVLVAARIERGGRLGRALIAACVLVGMALVAASAVKPDGLRDLFYYAWGWVPVAALAAVAVLAVRARRDPEGRPRLAVAVALAVVAATTYAFTLHGWRPQMSVYYAPLAAILLVRLHLVELARSRTAAVLGVTWVALLAAGGAWLALNEADRDQVTVHGPGGSLAEAPAEAALYQRAVDAIGARTAPGEPIFVSPLMTGLYVLSGHDSPLREISSLPTILSDPAEEREAVARLDRAGVRLVVTDTRTWKGYGHSSFGVSFQRQVAAWVEREFARADTIRGADRTLTVWVRTP
jgi:Dolichyl-phosphate-mannose-protein mannosyltransferase